MTRFLKIIVLTLFLSVNWTMAETDRIEELLSTMTLEQKVGQLFLVSIYGDTMNEPARLFLQQWQPGGVTMFNSNIESTQQIITLINSYQTTMRNAGGIPLFIATDQEGGIITRLRDVFTEWPPMSLVTATGNAEIAYRVGARMAEELHSVGINMNLAPVADMDTNIDNPIIGRRSPGSNLDLLAISLPAYVDGLQAGGVIATTKHFPGHGDTNEDSHLTLPVVMHDLDFLRERELQPFISAIQGGTDAIMMAHIWFSAIDSEPLPASLSYNIVTGLLREELGYDGIIMTDAMEMNAITATYSPGEAGVLAVQAGVDMLAYGTGMGEGAQSATMQAIVNAVRAGEISESRIDESVRRILSAKLEYGILDWTPHDLNISAQIDTNMTEALMQELFDAGVTIAFDRAGLIPITAERRVGIVYPGVRQRIGWTCNAYRDGIQWLSVTDFPDETEINSAVRLASQVDIIVVFGDNIRERRAYQDLINALPVEKTVVVAMRSPYDLLTFPDVAAYIMTYGPQNAGITTTCAILFGAQPASGSVSVNLPVD